MGSDIIEDLHDYQGCVDLGSVDWDIYNGMFYHRFDVGTMPLNVEPNGIPDIWSKRYETASYNSVSSHAKDKIFTSYTSAQKPTVFIYDTSYDNATTFKNAMSGVYMTFKTATQ